MSINMTFKNLVFIDHPNKGLNAIMAKHRFNSGKELSVVAGDNLYCTTKYGVRKGHHLLTEDDVYKFEVMIGGEVKGWQTREDITNIMKENEA
tara:strand:- start:134 stop:412 length:279 start_codon:yes stop_codon:yes gene_type:complete